MEVLIVNFEFAGLDDATYRQHCEQVAPAFLEVPGLIAKTWLADPATNTYGGVYHFANCEALDAYLASEIVNGLKANPYLTNFSTRTFGTVDAPTRITNSLLPLAAPASRGHASAAGRKPF